MKAYLKAVFWDYPEFTDEESYKTLFRTNLKTLNLEDGSFTDFQKKEELLIH